MAVRIVKSESQYREYLDLLRVLVAEDPDPDSPDGAHLELLSVLTEDYERTRYTQSLPDPVDAILFRMEEQGLQQRDLIPFIGSKSKVSEVLAGKRTLSVRMIRALSSGLGIPVSALIGSDEPIATEIADVNWSLLPSKEMARRGWLGPLPDEKATTLADSVRQFFERVGGLGVGPAYFRRTVHLGGFVRADTYTLNAWIARVAVRSKEMDAAPFERLEREELVCLLGQVVRLSSEVDGPFAATQFLAERGIRLVVEAQLKGMGLDGAAILTKDKFPVIGLTLRYDRIDNFWFTLLHELVHVHLHLSDHQDAFVDSVWDPSEDGDSLEVEANRLAFDAIVPRTIWRRSQAFRLQTVKAIYDLAKELKIHPALIAGRLRKETGNYRRFPNLVGQGEVRPLFEGVSY